ncbi:MAG: FliA/WhiG family RNA polymerase sigma factor [Clostridia bacterium]|nr:FliA/WhiG family RNA polymerase sigma factor [Clostridia bacterium]
MSISSLWKTYKETNDRVAKEQLIVEYVELVKIIAGRLYANYNHNVEYDDLVSYGIIGLIDAIVKFDIEKNVKFETYANIRIRGAIVDQIRSLDWIPRSTRQKYKKVEGALEKLQSMYGDQLTDELLAAELGISMEELYQTLNEVSNLAVLSLEDTVNETGTMDIRSDDVDMDPQASLDLKETENILREEIDKLPEKERLVISLYYYEELTYKEIASVMDISESRISQLHSKAIAKLRVKIKSF